MAVKSVPCGSDSAGMIFLERDLSKPRANQLACGTLR